MTRRQKVSTTLILLAASLSVVLVGGLVACSDEYTAPECPDLLLSAAVPANGNARLDNPTVTSRTISLLGVPHVRVDAHQVVGGVDFSVQVVFESATGSVYSVECTWVDPAVPPPGSGATCACSGATTACPAGGVSVNQPGREIAFTHLVLGSGPATTTLDGSLCYY